MEQLRTINEVWKFNLRLYRGDRTQSEIAEAANLSLRGYQRLEQGSLPKSPTTTANVAKALGVEETVLFADPELLSAPPPAPPAVEALIEKIGDQQKRIRDLEAKLDALGDLPSTLAGFPGVEMDDVVSHLRNWLPAHLRGKRPLPSGNDNGLPGAAKHRRKLG